MVETDALMQKCQIGDGRWPDAANDLLANCYGKLGRQQQRISELESWIPQAYKEGYQDAQNDESEGFDDDWMVSMAKMVFDEKAEES